MRALSGWRYEPFLSGRGLFQLSGGVLVRLDGKGGARYGGLFRRWGRACQLPVGGEHRGGYFVIVAVGFFPIPTLRRGGGGDGCLVGAGGCHEGKFSPLRGGWEERVAVGILR